MAIICDVILCSVMIFLLTFAWVNYCLHSIKLAVMLAVIVTVSSAYIITLILKKHFDVKNKKNVSKQNRESLKNFLKYNENNGQTFAPILTYYNFEVINVEYDSILAKKEHTCYFIFNFNGDNVTETQTVNYVIQAKRKGADKLYVMCNKVNGILTQTIKKQFDITFVDLENVYLLMEQADKLPPLTTKKQKRVFNPQYAFNKKRFKWYFGGCVYLLVTSIISPLKIYNIIWASIMFVLSCYSLLNTKYNVKPTAVTLD